MRIRRHLLYTLLLVSIGFAGAARAADRRVEMRFKPGATLSESSRKAEPAAAQPTLLITRVFMADNGDDDGWADTGETVSLSVEVRNPTNLDLTGVTIRITSDDPGVGCITRSLIHVGDVAGGATVVSEETFEWIVASSVSRTDPFEDLSVTFDMYPDAVEFQSPVEPRRLTLDLDLDAGGGAQPTTWFESFESGFGSFTTMHLDEYLNPPASDLGNHAAGVINADGARCQYSDPEWERSGSFGNGAGTICYPNPNAAPDRFWFATATDRAYSGTRSLRWNLLLPGTLGYTTPTSQIDALRTNDPVNLGWDRVCSLSRTNFCTTAEDCPAGEDCGYASPELTLKQQISLLDHRSVNTQSERTADRGVVAVQLADAEGTPAGPWNKVYPYLNVYDSQANSNYFACTFDPTDDGNDEGDFFDPADPLRSQGPSSTCAPEFSFAHQGDTDEPFHPGNLGDAAGPGLQGGLGIGTWVQPAFDLSRYRGRRLRVRLQTAGRKLGGALTWEQAFAFNQDPGDDGWFVDDIKITDALVTPAALSADLNDNLGLAICDDYFCGQSGGVEANLVVTPDGSTSMPGQPVQIDASGSTVDICLNGTLEYRFWIDVDGDGTFGPSLDVLLRDWTYNGRLTDTPVGTTHYAVAVRCESTPDCAQTAEISIEVDCPGPGDGEVDHGTPFLHDAPEDRRSIRLDGQPGSGDKDVIIYWTTAAIVDVVRGDLDRLRALGQFGFSESCAADNQATPTSFVDTTPTPDAGNVLFWLLRSASECDDPGAGGSYGNVGESADRDVIRSCLD